MTIDLELPRLHERKSRLEQDIYQYAQLVQQALSAGKDAAPLVTELQSLRAELYELNYAIDVVERNSRQAGTARIPVTQTVIVIAVLAWIITTFTFTYLALVR
jgi:hypothetical protein